MPSDAEASPPPPASREEKAVAVASSPADDAEVEDGQFEEGEVDEQNPSPPPGRDSSSSPADAESSAKAQDTPPLPTEPIPSSSTAPPLPSEPAPGQEQSAEDGWSAEWDAVRNAWYFYNRFTGHSQWDNPRVPNAETGAPAQAFSTGGAPGTTPSIPSAPPVSQLTSVAGGYNPAIHGSWDPNASYAQAYTRDPDEVAAAAQTAGGEALPDPAVMLEQGAYFNKWTGKFQTAEENPERHGDEAKSKRQMDAFFDVDKAANSHDGRSLKAERRGKQPTKQELAAWKEKRKAKKEEKRRAWLRD